MRASVVVRRFGEAALAGVLAFFAAAFVAQGSGSTSIGSVRR